MFKKNCAHRLYVKGNCAELYEYDVRIRVDVHTKCTEANCPVLKKLEEVK